MKPSKLLPFLFPVVSLNAQTNHALNQGVTPSSHFNIDSYPAENAVDGDLSDDARWLGAASPGGNTLDIQFPASTTLRQAHLYSGFGTSSSSTIDSFSLEEWNGFFWNPVQASSVSGSGYFATTINFDSPVTTNRIRLVINDTDANRLRDISLWTNPTDLYTGVTGDNLPLWVQNGFVNHALGKPVTASSGTSSEQEILTVDGVISSTSQWTSDIGSGETLEIDLGGSTTLEQAHVYNTLGTAGSAGEDLVTFEFTGNSLSPTLGNFATTNGITVSDITLGTLGDLFDDGAGDHLRITGSDTAFGGSSDAISAEQYLSFTIIIPDTVAIDLTSLSADIEVVNAASYANSRVYSSIDGFDEILSDTIGAIGRNSSGSSAQATQTLNLRNPEDHDNAGNPGTNAVTNILAGDFDNLSNTTITFYLPWIDNSGSESRYTDLDNLKVQAALHAAGGSIATSEFHLESWNGSSWNSIAGTNVSGSTGEEHVLTFISPVSTDRIRIVNDNTAGDDSGRLRIRELALWNEDLPLYTGMTGPGILDPTGSNTPIVSLNQIGYQSDAPKRFTAPIAEDGSAFEITTEADPLTVLFTGTITDGLGDFTAFQPANPGPYILTYVHEGNPVSSFPFLIQSDLIEDKLVPPAIKFMIDSRSGVGTDASGYGGNPWRDGTYYSFEIPSLIYLHLNAREVSENTTNGLDYAADKALVEAPNFREDFRFTTQDRDYGDGQGDVVDTLEDYYATFDPPLPGCPDALNAVHFGLGFTMLRPSTKEPAGDPLPRHFHSQTREWFAWFLYAWPEIRTHFPDSFYEECRDFTFANWAASSGINDSTVNNNRPSPLDIDPLWETSSYGGHDKHPFKGRHAPGHSILPNLLLWQVALREGRSDANVYLAAAQAQTQWVIDHLDWTIPAATKGHRMSEHKLMPGLVHFLRQHPNEAPAGLAAKIEEWADIMISRSDNMWDFRRYELTDVDNDGVVDWTLPKRSANWNEPGNLAGFPACALAAAWTLDHEPAKQQRLRELSQSAIDCLFGRNPLNTGSASRPQLGFPDQETAWTPAYSGAAAWLEGSVGVLNSGPGSEHFPYNPTAGKRWNEGWVNFNASFNMALSYMLADRTPEPQPLAISFPLRISEILAHPCGDPAAEFIELHNPSTSPVRLGNLTLGGDISFTFPANQPDLAPDARILIVRNQTIFENTFSAGLTIAGTFNGTLPDTTGTVTLGDTTGSTFHTITYTTPFPCYSVTWPDGETSPRLSSIEGGTPSTNDSTPFQGGNLLAHATGSSELTLLTITSGQSIAFSENLRADDTSLDLQSSPDLTNWTTESTTSQPQNDGTLLHIFTPDPATQKLFFRLKATHTP